MLRNGACQSDLSMRVLFVHQHFPGQFVHLAPVLAADPQHTVVALTLRQDLPALWNGVRVVPHRPARGSTPGIHPWMVDMEAKAIRAEAAMKAALQLRASGFVPDVIVSHPGWGESLFLKDVWPQARLGIYCEFFYHAQGADVGFDPEFRSDDPGEAARLRLKNVNSMLHFQVAEAGLAPTHWQASLFPAEFRNRITVVHDGVDTQSIAPNPQIRLRLETGLEFSRGDELITFVNRNLEPYRGYHIFMRALPEILRRRPNARVLIVGGSDVSYGARPPQGQSWANIFAARAREQMPDADWARVHFLGQVPHASFVGLLQLSTVHVYLTYPFVLGWSLLEAMSAGCAIVASDTAPVREAIADGVTGRLVDFFDVPSLAHTVCELLKDASARSVLGVQARAHVQQHYDLRTVCLPRQLAWVKALASG